MDRKKPSPIKASDYGKGPAIKPATAANDTAETDGKKTLSLWSNDSK